MDYIKSIMLYTDHLLENGAVYETQEEKGVVFKSWKVGKDMLPTVLLFSYKCQRSRNDAGFPYGNTLPSELKFTIKLGDPNDSKLYYGQLKDNELFDYSFLFNPSFDDSKNLTKFDDAMIVRGYVVDVKEDFDSGGTTNATADQVLLEVTLLLSSISYVGKDNQLKVLEITRY